MVRDVVLAVGGLALGVTIILAGYRDGSVGGLFAMVAGGLVVWLVARMVAWSIPTIGEVQDRAREDGLLVPGDLREHDPDIRQDQHLARMLDRRGRSR
jgi:hypothetical protein